jgi:putative DNA primase/helicase
VSRRYALVDIARVAAHAPQALRELPVWLLWREGTADGTGTKPKKEPFYADGKRRSGTLDSPADRKRLVTFDAVANAFDAARYTGVGVALGRVPEVDVQLCGIDLDRCLTADRMTVAPAARPVLNAAGDAYVEVSPSGDGLKVFGTGDIGSEATAELEIYSGKRFFTVTGERFAGSTLDELARAAAVARTHLHRHAAQTAATVAEGSRNNTLWQYACSLRAQNVADEDARALVHGRNAQFCPPLPERDVDDILKRAWKYEPGYANTDDGNARRFAARYGDDLRYVYSRRKYLRYVGPHWVEDDGAHVEAMARQAVRDILTEAHKEEQDDRRRKLSQWALASQSASRIAAMYTLARSDLAVDSACLDADPMLLGVANGVVDLRTGALREASRGDLITRCTGIVYDPHAKASRWSEFIATITAGDVELAEWLQRSVGYTLTGDTREQCVFLLYGLGANGKSVFLNTLRAVLGDYGTVTSADTWMVRERGGAASNDLAALRGTRLVVSSETEDGQRFAEVMVKQVTGGDSLKARFLYGEFFEFRPAFKLWIAANHKPIIRGDDFAIWRRIRLVPFTVTIPTAQQDRALESKLRDELPGILAWAVEGCRAWQRDGLPMPKVVVQATAEYKSEMDHFGEFLTERCVVEPRAQVSAKALFAAYLEWADASGIDRTWTLQKFGRKLAERGITKDRTRLGFMYRGVRLRDRGEQRGLSVCEP